MKKNYLLGTLNPRIMCALTLILGLGMSLGFSQHKFKDSLEVPPIFDTRNDSLFVDVDYHDFGLPGLDSVQTLGYNHASSGKNSYLGPTLTWYKGQHQDTYLKNRLPKESAFRTTVHWHGANIPAYTDGGPHQFFDPDSTFEPAFTVLDNPTTLWYHPHAEARTYTQVQLGLAGIIIVKEAGDPVDAIAPHTYDHDDIPLIIQDIPFKKNTDTTVNPPAVTYSIDTVKARGRTIVLNGKVQPYRDVPAQPIRFRILDGSSRSSFMVTFVTDTLNPKTSRVPFWLLMSDGGYIQDSLRRLDSLRVDPGVRMGIIVDFTNHAGDTIYAMHNPGSLRKGIVGSATNGPLVKSRNVFFQIRVGATPVAPIGAIPASLPGIAPGDTTIDTTIMKTAVSRVIRLTGLSGDGPPLLGIDDNQYDFNKINTEVRLHTTEDWTVRNETNVAHPFHIHLIQFHVTAVQDLAGNPLPMPAEYLGPKDDILVYPGEQVIFRAQFNTYGQPKPFSLDSSAYMYHCHILTHEDGYYATMENFTIEARSSFGMMQQFAVWDGTTRTTSIEEAFENEMVLYPNPTKKVVYLNSECPKMSMIRLFDLQGRLLKEQAVAPFVGSVPIDVSDLARGMIIVQWDMHEGKQVKKVVLE